MGKWLTCTKMYGMSQNNCPFIGIIAVPYRGTQSSHGV